MWTCSNKTKFLFLLPNKSNNPPVTLLPTNKSNPKSKSKNKNKINQSKYFWDKYIGLCPIWVDSIKQTNKWWIRRWPNNKIWCSRWWCNKWTINFKLNKIKWCCKIIISSTPKWINFKWTIQIWIHINNPIVKIHFNKILFNKLIKCKPTFNNPNLTSFNNKRSPSSRTKILHLTCFD